MKNKISVNPYTMDRSDFRAKHSLARATESVRDKFRQIRSTQLENKRLLEEQYKPVTKRLGDIQRDAQYWKKLSKATFTDIKSNMKTDDPEDIDYPRVNVRAGAKKKRLLSESALFHSPKKFKKQSVVSNVSKNLEKALKLQNIKINSKSTNDLPISLLNTTKMESNRGEEQNRFGEYDKKKMSNLSTHSSKRLHKNKVNLKTKKTPTQPVISTGENTHAGLARAPITDLEREFLHDLKEKPDNEQTQHARQSSNEAANEIMIDNEASQSQRKLRVILNRLPKSDVETELLERKGGLHGQSNVHSSSPRQSHANLPSLAVQQLHRRSSRLNSHQEHRNLGADLKNHSTSHRGEGIIDLSLKHLNMKDNQNMYTYWNDPNELVQRLRLLISSTSAGHTGHQNEISSIIEELREADIIK